MIRISNLTKYYGTKRALNRLDLTVESGEIVGLVGKNGAGKSTALKILSCQLLPTEGDVNVDGVSVTQHPEAVRRRIGYLPEQPPLYPEMTVTGYLEFCARLRGVSKAEVAERREAVMGETGLTGVGTERLSGLSRGFQQRVGIAQAIIHQPDVVLLDEPMSGLDPLQIVQIRELIRSLRKRHTVLFSSHILSEITNVCDRVALIDQGALKAEGTEEALRESLSQRQRLFLLVRGEAAAVRGLLGGMERVKLEALEVRAQGVVEAHLRTQGDVRESLSRACHQAGLGLLELRSERHGLEELFVELLGKTEAA